MTPTQRERKRERERKRREEEKGRRGEDHRRTGKGMGRERGHTVRVSQKD